MTLPLPEGLVPVFCAAFGLVVGSFLNVVIHRVPRKRSVVKPGSACPKCRRQIRWFDNIPVASYLALRGRCRSCGFRIPVRYPIVELVTAALFVLAFQRQGLGWQLVLRDWPLIAVLIAVVFIDWDHRIIPDPLSWGGMAWGLATSFAFSRPGWESSVLGAVIGFGFFFAFAWLYERVTGRAGLGGGDIKLLGMLGAFLGAGAIVPILLVSSIAGTMAGVVWALSQKKRNIRTFAIPYGPFLVAGALFYYFLGDLLWYPFMIQI